jgi:aspartate carbamoyltransferase catalytic subunit
MDFDAIPLKRQKTFDPEDKREPGLLVPPHLISINDLSLGLVNQLLVSAESMKSLVLTEGGCDILKNKVLASVFYEPSTRTR